MVMQATYESKQATVASVQVC